MSSSLLDSRISTSPPPSPTLINLNPAPPPITLLDAQDDLDHHYLSSLNPQATPFQPSNVTSSFESVKDSSVVSLLEGVLIDVPGGGSLVFRPNLGKSLVETGEKGLIDRGRDRTPAVRARSIPVVSFDPKSHKPLVEFEQPYFTSHESIYTLPTTFTTTKKVTASDKREESPSPTPSPEDRSYPFTPDLSPQSSFSSRSTTPEFPPDLAIIPSTPQEIAGLFTLDNSILPQPTGTSHHRHHTKSPEYNLHPIPAEGETFDLVEIDTGNLNLEYGHSSFHQTYSEEQILYKGGVLGLDPYPVIGSTEEMGDDPEIVTHQLGSSKGRSKSKNMEDGIWGKGNQKGGPLLDLDSDSTNDEYPIVGQGQGRGGKLKLHDFRPYRDDEEEGVDLGRPVIRGTGSVQGGGGRGGGLSSPKLYRPPPSLSFGIKPSIIKDSMGTALKSPYEILLSTPSPRLNVPPHLLRQQSALQVSIMESWMGVEPSLAMKQYVARFLERLSQIVNARFGERSLGNKKGLRRFEVDVFGSVGWGGETGTSGDLDLVILDKMNPQGYHPSLWRVPPGDIVESGRRRLVAHTELPKVYHTFTLARALMDNGMMEAQAIPGANTPIVKFKDPGEMGIDCDVNINDLGGWYNSSMILHYCLISPHVLRPLIHTLKLWAAAHQLNDASGAKGPATMSSYCLTLMAIAYLQHRGVLPNLQTTVKAPIPEDPAGEDDPDTVWVSWGKEQGIKAHVGFEKQVPLGWTSAVPAMTAAEAVQGFFAFYSQTLRTPGDDRMDYTRQMVSVLNGGIIDRAKPLNGENSQEVAKRQSLLASGMDLATVNRILNAERESRFGQEKWMGKGDIGIQPRNWGERKIVVQDPFLWQKNCAGAMSGKGSERFLQTIDKTRDILSRPGATIDDILFNPNPIPMGPPRRGRGRGGFTMGMGQSGRGSPSLSRGSSSSRGSGPNRQLWMPGQT